MSRDFNARTPEVTNERATVAPFVILIIIVLLLAVGAYLYWPEMEQVLSSPTPSGTAPATRALLQP